MKRYFVKSATEIVAANRRVDSYLKDELQTACDTLNQRGKDAVISDDNESITFEAKSGEKITVRVKRVLVPEYHVIDDLGNDIYVSTDPQKDAIAFEILNEYRNN